MKILVSGSSGYIGNYLVKHLKDSGYEVSGYNRTNLDDDFKIKQFKSFSPDIFIHCAGIAHVNLKKQNNNINQVILSNTIMTARLANISLNSGVKQFIFLSSAKIYGSYSVNKISFEETDKPNPEGVYAESKFLAEQELIKICSNSKLNFTILRLPLVYGENNKANFEKLDKLVMLGFPLPFKDINNKRSIINLNNLSNFIHNSLNNEKAYNQIFNLCDDGLISTNYLIEILAKKNKKKLFLFKINMKFIHWMLKIIGYEHIYNALWRSFVLKNDKSKKLLDWTPTYNLDDIFR